MSEPMDGTTKISAYLQDLKKFAQPRILIFTAVGAAFGASHGYYTSGTYLKYTAFSSAGALLFSTAFFTGVYTIRQFRNIDDIATYAVPSAISSFVIAAGLTTSTVRIATRNGAVGLGVGALFGGAYKYLGDIIFDFSKEQWLNYRANIELTSKHLKLISIKRPIRRAKDDPLNDTVTISADLRIMGSKKTETKE